MIEYSPSKDLLRGRTILVTGAGDGIGKAAAIAYALHGAQVLLLGRTQEKLESVSDEIKTQTPTDPIIVPLDLAVLNEESAHELTHGIQDDCGRLDGVLHNASLLGPKVPIEHYPAHDWATLMQVNVHAQYLLTRELIPLLRASDDASIIFTSSGVGRKGRAYWGAYAVTKFATEGLMEVLANELSETTNIRVNSLNPGGTRTSMRAAAYPAEDPLSLPTPEDHMPLYLYLMGPDSKGVTGRKWDTAMTSF